MYRKYYTTIQKGLKTLGVAFLAGCFYNTLIFAALEAPMTGWMLKYFAVCLFIGFSSLTWSLVMEDEE